MSEPASNGFALPPALVSRADLARLVREVEQLDNDFEVQKVRDHKDEAHYTMPATSRSLQDFLKLNEINVSDAKTRTALKEQLRKLKDKAPVVHATFAVDADPEFLQQLVAWFRGQIHPQTLISVGLQPGLIGGMHLRTPNHVHDFSLRALLASKRGILLKELQGLQQ
ncbi:hypothetical protein EYC59_02750 [Candidatus Saccharibacteria bacterium]|nr:MAG: hypothetical protein EYC59_02750 [Candidatus Saccharibacteria bacterium]